MGPLHGIRTLGIAGIGPGPFCTMLLADLGAEVIRIERAEGPAGSRQDVSLRNRRSLALVLKQPAPAPRFSRTPANLRTPPPLRAEHSQEVLAEFGFTEAEIIALTPVRH